MSLRKVVPVAAGLALGAGVIGFGGGLPSARPASGAPPIPVAAHPPPAPVAAHPPPVPVAAHPPLAPVAAHPPPVPVAAGAVAPPAPAKPPPRPTPDQYRKLVRDLGADDFRVREAAAERLSESGILARPWLLGVISDPDPELAHRARRLLGDLVWTSPEDPEPVRLLLEGYNRAQPLTRTGTARRVARLGSSVGWENVLPAVLRLLRHEEHPDVRGELIDSAVRWSSAEVQKALRTLPPEDPPHPADLLLAAEGARTDPDKALALLDKAVEAEAARRRQFRFLGPGMTEALLVRRASAAEAAGKPDRAGADHLERVEVTRGSPGAVLGLLSWRLLRGDHAGVTEAAGKHPATAGSDPRCLLVQSWSAADAGRSEEAAALQAKAEAKVARDPADRIDLAEFALSRGRTATAEALFTPVAAATPADNVVDHVINARLAQAEIAMAAGRPADAVTRTESAVKLLEERLRAGPGSYYFKTTASQAALRARLAWVKFAAADAGRRPDAEALLTALVDVAPDDAEAGLAAVTALRKRNRAADAEALIARSLVRRRTLDQRDPDPGHRGDMAWLLAKAGVRVKEAVTLAESALDADPGRASLWDSWAEVCAADGRPADALAAARRALELEPFRAAYLAQVKRFAGAK